MSQWKSSANTAGAPKWVAYGQEQGSGNSNEAANNTALVVNTTPGAWVLGAGNSAINTPTARNKAIGIFPVTPLNKANTNGESAKVHGLGWSLRVAGEGPILTMTAANGQFANGETVLVSGGSVNAVAVLGTNATGNLTSATVISQGFYPNNAAITRQGLFTNTSASGVTVTFTRERHVANLNFSNSTALTNVGAANVINVTISNTQINYGVNAFASFTSNSTSGITNTQTQAITWGGANSTVNWGLFAPSQTNTNIVVTFTNANGSVVGGTYTATANLAASSGGAVAVATLGGRAGRVTYEMLVIDRHIANGASSVANTTQLPQ